MDAPEPLEHGGGSPGPAADDLKEDGPKENTEGAPTAEGREKVEGGADSDEGGPGGPGAAGAGASSFCGAGDEVGVVGVLPDDLDCRSPSNESLSGVFMRDLTPGF